MLVGKMGLFRSAVKVKVYKACRRAAIPSGADWK
jgi:hypothetical protein